MLQKPCAISTHWWMDEVPNSFSCKQSGVFQQEGDNEDEHVSRQVPWQPHVFFIATNHCQRYCWKSIFQSNGRQERWPFGTDNQSKCHKTVQVTGRRIVSGHHQELATFQSRNWICVRWIVVSPNCSCYHPASKYVQELKTCGSQRSHGEIVCSSAPRRSCRHDSRYPSLWIKNMYGHFHRLLTSARIWESLYSISVFESTLKGCSTTSIWFWFYSLNDI